MYYHNEKLEKLHRVFDQNDRTGYLRLDLNENPSGLPNDVLEKVLSKLTPDKISQYPETARLSTVLSEYLDVDVSQICLTNGSAEAIRYVIEGFTSESGRVVGVNPSYMMFKIFSQMYGRNFIEIPYNDDLSMDVDKILAAMTDDTQLLILLNPNNPMGNVYSELEIETIIEKAKEKHITVLIDEAYHYFYPGTFVEYAKDSDHIFITRTFSKFFSMAGCRLGYIVGSSDCVKIIQKLCTPHNTNVLAVMLAEELLMDSTLQSRLMDDFNQGKALLIDELEKNKYQYHGYAGNFIFIRPKTDADDVVKKMKEKKILIKSYKNVGNMGDCLRITIGDKSCMRLFVDALIEIEG